MSPHRATPTNLAPAPVVDARGTTLTPGAGGGSLHAEAAFVASLPMDSERVLRVADSYGLRPEHFSDPRAAAVFSACIELRAGRHGDAAVDLASVSDVLQRRGQLDGLQGWLDRAAQDCIPSHCEAHAAEILADYRRRTVADAIADAAKRIGTDDPGEVLAKLQSMELPGSGINEGHSLTALAEMPIDPEAILLGESPHVRYLCKGGGMLFVGPSGIGKSTASAQQDIQWSRGCEAFGIRPTKPLNILTVQAENDDGDLHVMASGIMQGLRLSEAECDLVRKNTRYISHNTSTGDAFIAYVQSLLATFKPHLLRIDPFQAYLGADPTDTERVAAFCRNGLNPLMKRYNCGVILCHHTPKTNGKDTSAWAFHDWQYIAAGCADLVNWCRAELVVWPEGDGVFRFRAAKRWPGWRDDNGEPIHELYFRHSRQSGVVLWEPVAACDVVQPNRKPTPEDVFALVVPGKTIEKNALLSLATRLVPPIGENRARKFIAELVHDGRLYEVTTKRRGTNPCKSLTRTPPPEEGIQE